MHHHTNLNTHMAASSQDDPTHWWGKPGFSCLAPHSRDFMNKISQYVLAVPGFFLPNKPFLLVIISLYASVLLLSVELFPLFERITVYRSLCSFWFKVIVNKTAVNIRVHILMWTYVFILFSFLISVNIFHLLLTNTECGISEPQKSEGGNENASGITGWKKSQSDTQVAWITTSHCLSFQLKYGA